MKLKVIIKADSRFPINRKRIRRTVASVLKENNVESDVEISLSIVGDRKMKDLNKNYLGREGTTSIISFPLEKTEEDYGLGFAGFPDDVLRLGDLVISYPQALKMAIEENILIDEEIENLIRHGMKSLLGVEH